MKAISKISFIISFIAIFIACGPNAEEKAAMEKHKQDSIDNVQAMEKARMDSVAALAKNQEDKKNSLQNELAGLKQKRPMIESAIMQAKADLAAAYSKMQSIQNFHFGRSADQKAEEIRQQTLAIENWQKRIQDMQQTMEDCDKRIKNSELELQKYN